MSEFSLPLVNAKNDDNGIMYYGRPEDFESTEMALDIIEDGEVSTGNCYPEKLILNICNTIYLQ
ncbi:MAG: hypothetical protein HDT23_02035 [Ruminococcus sp.]|nr:hypothetical protein [Ruminococcus sp.]